MVSNSTEPFLHGINPLFETVSTYKREITGFLGNVTAATQATVSGSNDHYLRTLPMLSAEGMATYPNRFNFNRNNAYVKPGAYLDVGKGGLKSFHVGQCSSGIRAQLDPNTPTNPDFTERVRETGDDADEDFFNRLKEYAFNGADNTDSMPQARCEKQGKFAPIGAPGPATDYPQVHNGR